MPRQFQTSSAIKTVKYLHIAAWIKSQHFGAPIYEQLIAAAERMQLCRHSFFLYTTRAIGDETFYAIHRYVHLSHMHLFRFREQVVITFTRFLRIIELKIKGLCWMKFTYFKRGHNWCYFPPILIFVDCVCNGKNDKISFHMYSKHFILAIF